MVMNGEASAGIRTPPYARHPGHRKGQGGRLSSLPSSVGGSELASLRRDAGVATPAPCPNRDQIYPRPRSRRKRISATISDAFQPPSTGLSSFSQPAKLEARLQKKKKKNSVEKPPPSSTKAELSEWILWFVFTLTDFSLWSCAKRSAAERFKGKVLRL